MSDYLIAIPVISTLLLFIGFISSNRRLKNEIQQRIKLEKILQHEQSFAQRIMNKAPVIILLLTTDGSIEYTNPYFEKLSGYKLSEIKGKSWIKTFLPTRDQVRIQKLFNSVIHTKPVDGYVNPIVVKGEEREIEWYARNMKNAAGETTGVLSVGLDVTEKNINKRELSVNESRLKEAQKITKLGNWELDLKTNTLFWSDEIYNIFNIDKNKFGASYDFFLEAIHPDDREMVNASYIQSLKDKKPYEIKHRLKDINETISYVNETCETFFDEDGNPLRSIGTVQDITKSVKDQQEIENTNARLEAILESISDAIIYTDHNRVIKMINKKALQYFGYSESELIGKNTQILYASKEVFDQEGARINKRLDSKNKDESEVYDLEYKHKDGSTFIGEGRGSHVALLSGKKLGYVGIVRDITLRRKAEDELKNYQKDLEKEVKLRTSYLVSAREEADRANQAKSEFLSRMSHELRTPMNAILGFAQILELDEDNLTEYQSSNIKEILEAGSHLLLLINDVLDLAKVESGSVEINLERLLLNDVMNESIALLKPQITNNNLTVINQLSNSNQNVVADFTGLKQVFINVLSNAIKYNSDNGKIIIEYDIINSKYLHVLISDTGNGIAENDLDKLFIPFERLDIKNNVEGTGIGLVITKNIMELMKGKIGVKSTIGKGSTFWIELPLP